jgi:hypothetical protein
MDRFSRWICAISGGEPRNFERCDVYATRPMVRALVPELRLLMISRVIAAGMGHAGDARLLEESDDA